MRGPGSGRSWLERVHWFGGCLIRVTAAGIGGLFLLACLLEVRPVAGPLDLWLIAVAAVVGLAALVRRRAAVWTAVAVGLSAYTTALVGVTGAEMHQPSMFIEICGLLVLTLRVVWRTRSERLVAATVAVLVTIVTLAFRLSPREGLVLSAPLAVLAAAPVGLGIYLRALDARRARALRDARRDERLELARDLHDFVAHHITGIVVQAQAARFAAQSGAVQTPEQIDAAFAGIERAGTEALTSMRRIVGLLRDAQNGGPAAPRDEGGGEESSARPVGDLARVEELVAAFTDPPAKLTVDPGLGGLPPEIATSVHRIVQEALTNIRKHAADATEVEVEITRGAGGVEVSVRDDGQGRGRRLPSSGFGLVGLAERVEALGGRMRAGRRPEGGWEVVAVLPVG